MNHGKDPEGAVVGCKYVKCQPVKLRGEGEASLANLLQSSLFKAFVHQRRLPAMKGSLYYSRAALSDIYSPPCLSRSDFQFQGRCNERGSRGEAEVECAPHLHAQNPPGNLLQVKYPQHSSTTYFTHSRNNRSPYFAAEYIICRGHNALE